MPEIVNSFSDKASVKVEASPPQVVQIFFETQSTRFLPVSSVRNCSSSGAFVVATAILLSFPMLLVAGYLK
jgi:hypothetical protein